jgi:hypothetical protein
MNLSLAFVCASWSRLQVARRLPNDRPVLCPRIFSGMSQLTDRKEPHSTLEKCRGIDTTICIPTGFELPLSCTRPVPGELHPATPGPGRVGQDSIARNQQKQREDPIGRESVGDGDEALASMANSASL